MTTNRYSPEVRSLMNSVRRHLTKDERQDVLKHGIDAGFGGFITYTETQRWYNRHKEAIWELLAEAAEDYGQPPLTILSYFKPGGEPETLYQFENKLYWWGVTRACEILQSKENDNE